MTDGQALFTDTLQLEPEPDKLLLCNDSHTTVVESDNVIDNNVLFAQTGGERYAKLTCRHIE